MQAYESLSIVFIVLQGAQNSIKFQEDNGYASQMEADIAEKNAECFWW